MWANSDMTDWILMKPVNIINLTFCTSCQKCTYSQNCTDQILTKVERNDKPHYHQRLASQLQVTYMFLIGRDRDYVTQARKHIYSSFFHCFYPDNVISHFFLSRRLQGKIGGGSVCDIINNRMKGSCSPPPHPSVSPLFLLPCYSSMLNTSASAFACVA